MTATALDLPALFAHTGYEPHRGQRKIHASGARNRVACCGRRFGKSTVGGYELIPEAVRAYHEASGGGGSRDLGGRRYWIVGPNYDDAEREFRVFYNACRGLELPFDKPGTYYNPGQPSSHQVSLWDGAFIVECRSAAHPESLDGEGLDGVIMAEAAKMKRNVWSKFIRPALSDKRGWSLWLSTPEGKNHFYDAWQRGQDPAHGTWASWRMPSWANDTIYPGGRDDPEIQAMAAEMSRERFKQEIGADFTDYVGRVFKDWDEEVHVRDLEYDPRYPLIGAVDYGFRNPFVWLAIQLDAFDNIRVLGEYYVTERDINDIARDLARWPLAANAREFFPDPASPGDTAVLERALRVKARGHTGGELKHRLELIKRWLKYDPEKGKAPKLLVDRSCVNMIREMDEYRYPDDRPDDERRGPVREEPLKKDDHTPEALGRFFAGHFGHPGSTGSRNARVRRANVTVG